MSANTVLTCASHMFIKSNISTVVCVMSSAANVGVLAFTACFYTFIEQDVQKYLLLVWVTSLTVHGAALFTSILNCSECCKTATSDTPILTQEHNLKDELNESCLDSQNTDDTPAHDMDMDIKTEMGSREAATGYGSIVMGTEAGSHSCSYSSLQVFRSPRTHLLVTPTAVVKGLKYLTINNVNLFAFSLGMDQYTTILPYISPVLSIVTKYPTGFIVDRFALHVSRAWHVLTCVGLVIAANLLAMYLLDHISVLVLCICLWTLSADVVMAVEPASSTAYFGHAHFALISGQVYGVEAATMLAGQITFGYFYHSNLRDYLVTCFGLHCFYNNFIAGIILAVLCGLSTCTHIYISRNDE